jgi:transcriptional regulator with XRE-family HTH domain
MELGDKLKTARLKKKITLKELSEKSKVSTSQLSQVERNVSIPTVTNLMKIAEALNTNIGDLVPQQEEDSQPSSPKRLAKRPPVGVVRKGERKKILLPTGSSYELLSPDLQHKLEFIYIYHPVGKTTKIPSHEGEECGLVLEGTYKGIIGGQETILEPGDSIYYDSTIPHTWEAIGDKDVKAIWVITPPSF